MKIHEYQAKEIAAKYGIPVPKGGVASTPQEARKLAQELGGRVVVKAQVHAGGRGKAGGVKIANSPQEAEQIAASLLGRRLVTHQTGPAGVPVRRVLVEEAMQTKKELYLGIVIDSAAHMPVVMASESGGMEIEEVAATTPEKILMVHVDPATGFQPFQGRKLAYGMNLPEELVRPAVDLIGNLYKIFEAKDCSLAEINPLVITADNRLLALDAKLNFEDDAIFRHPEVPALRDTEQEEPLEVEASKYGIAYVKLDGCVGCMVNGAGLAMATMDVIEAMGSGLANFLDVGGGTSQEKVYNAFKLIMMDPNVKSVLLNFFGGILRCDVAANGIVQAVKERGGVAVPIIVRMLGTNAEEGKQILKESGIKVILADDLTEAARRAVSAG